MGCSLSSQSIVLASQQAGPPNGPFPARYTPENVNPETYYFDPSTQDYFGVDAIWGLNQEFAASDIISTAIAPTLYIVNNGNTIANQPCNTLTSSTSTSLLCDIPVTNFPAGATIEILFEYSITSSSTSTSATVGDDGLMTTFPVYSTYPATYTASFYVAAEPSSVYIYPTTATETDTATASSTPLTTITSTITATPPAVTLADGLTITQPALHFTKTITKVYKKTVITTVTHTVQECKTTCHGKNRKRTIEVYTGPAGEFTGEVTVTGSTTVSTTSTSTETEATGTVDATTSSLLPAATVTTTEIVATLKGQPHIKTKTVTRIDTIFKAYPVTETHYTRTTTVGRCPKKYYKD